MVRRPLFLIAAGATALLLALFLLWQSTLSDEPAIARTAERPPVAEPADQPTSAPPASRPAARAGRITASGSPAPTRGTSTSAPSLGAPSESTEYVDPMSNTENLHFGATQMYAQHAAVEPLVRDCIAKATAAGQRPSGTAMLTYVVAKHGDKYEIEDTSYDDDETTLAEGPLLDCLHKTAKAMKYVGLPRRSQALVVMRRVKIENGTLAEYQHVSFSYLR